jgi:AcrR family transcriptional regulator
MRAINKKRQIIHKTVELLSTMEDSDEITTRSIAEHAGINPAMVNYYFGSKDNLLKNAIALMGGDTFAEAPLDRSGTRKAMFDHLVRMCEVSIQFSRYGFSKDAAALSKDALEASAKIIELKGLHGSYASHDDDAVAIFKIVSFLLLASENPEKFEKHSGIDIRVKSQLRVLVSKQLDMLLGDSL